MKKECISVMIACGSALVLAACSDQTRGQYDQAGHSAGAAIRSDLQVGAAEAKKDIQEGAVKAKQTGAQLLKASIAPKVKTALLAAPDLKAGDINVTAKGQTIFLTGSVPSADQKTRAVGIAKDQAGPSYQIKDELTIVPL